MANVDSIINSHNKKLLQECANPPETEERLCNCRQRDSCPMNGECLRKSIIYQATVHQNNGSSETYIGLTENTFKTRYANHKASFKHPSKRHSTELSKHIWSLKESNTDFTISWKIMKHAVAFNGRSRRCNLCLDEKYFILYCPELASLNKRNELVTTCRHATKFYLNAHKT